jgi:hypothetical protein
MGSAGKLRRGKARARFGAAGRSWVRKGVAKADDLSAGGYGPLRWALWSSDGASRGWAGYGGVW